MLVVIFALLAVGIGLADEEWRNTETTTMLWRLISEKRSNELAQLILSHQKEVLTARSEDGRGALFWAWEYGNEEALAIFLNFGIDIESDEMKDADGSHPKMMAYDPEPLLEKARSQVPTWKDNIEQIIERIKEMRKQQEMERIQEEDDGEYDDVYYDDEEEGVADDSEKDEEGIWNFEEDASPDEEFHDELR